MRNKANFHGPFLRRLWIPDEDFELETAKALHAQGLLPSEPSPVNIELFIEKQFGISYDFDTLPRGVLGRMTFGEAGPVEVVLHQALDSQRKSRNHLCRSTLAHECGHGLYHTPLYTELWQAHRRGQAGASSLEETGKNLNADSSDVRWWEYQANRAMGALLVPRELLVAALANTTFSRKLPNRWTPAERALFAEHVSRRFDVSTSFAARRIARLFPQDAMGRNPSNRHSAPYEPARERISLVA